MDLQTLLDLYEQNRGSVLSDASEASAIAQTIISGHAHLSELLDVIVSYYSMLSSGVKADSVSYEPVDAPMGSEYYQLYANYRVATDYDWCEQITQAVKKAYDAIPDEYLDPNLPNTKVITANTDSDAFILSITGNSVGGGISINGVRILKCFGSYQPPQWHYPVKWLTKLPDELSFNAPHVKDILYSLMSGYGVAENYANILNKASDIVSATSENVAATITAVQDFINAQQWLTAFDKSDFLSALASGVAALKNAVIGKIAGFKNEADSAEQAGSITFPSNTTMSISNFAPGMVLGTIETILNVVSVVAFAINRIVGAIAFVVKTVVTVIARVWLAATTAYEDTRFSIKFNSSTTDQVASFCVNQMSNYSSPTLAKWMRDNGYLNITYSEEPYSPFIHYIYIANPTALYGDPDYGYINFETHLSLMFDVFKGTAVQMRPAGISSALSDLITYWGHSSSISYFKNSGALLATKNTDYLNAYLCKDDETNKYVLLSFLENTKVIPYDSHNVATPFIGLGRMTDDELMKPYEWAQWAYDPISFSRMSAFTYLWDDGMQIIAYRRVASAVLLAMYSLCGYEILHDEANGAVPGGSIVFSFFDDLFEGKIWCGNADQFSIGVLHLNDFFKGLLGPVLSSDGKAFTNMQSNYTAMHDSIDNMCVGLVDLFNVIAFTNAVHTCDTKAKIGLHSYYVSSYGSPVTDYDAIGLVSVQGTSFVSGLNWATPIYTFIAGQSLIDESHAVPHWPSKFLLELPKLTFSGYIAGLIVDGLILVAAAAVTVLAIVGKVALHNKASKLQARAEGKWWAYHDNYDESGTPEAKAANEARWKEYKMARLKNNLFATFTGNSRMSLGMYDEETADRSEILDKITGFTTPTDDETIGDVVDTTPSLSVIYSVITGKDGPTPEPVEPEE